MAFEEIIEQLTNNNIKVIEYKGILTKEEIDRFSTAIKNNKSLTSLKLYENNLNDYGVIKIINALKTSNNVQELEFSNNNIGAASIRKIVRNLNRFHNLNKLVLSFNQIDNYMAKELAEALKANNSIEILYLSNNKIGDNGIEYFSAALRVNTSLKVLGLTNNLISNNGLEYLFDALKVNRSVKTLYLEGNNICYSVSLYNNIASLIKENKYLEEIHLQRTVLFHSHYNPLSLLLKIVDSIKLNRTLTVFKPFDEYEEARNVTTKNAKIINYLRDSILVFKDKICSNIEQCFFNADFYRKLFGREFAVKDNIAETLRSNYTYKTEDVKSDLANQLAAKLIGKVSEYYRFRFLRIFGVSKQKLGDFALLSEEIRQKIFQYINPYDIKQPSNMSKRPKTSDVVKAEDLSLSLPPLLPLAFDLDQPNDGLLWQSRVSAGKRTISREEQITQEKRLKQIEDRGPNL